MNNDSAPIESVDSELYAPYEWHATTLRAWLVAYGIGAPALLLTQEPLYNKLLQSGNARIIAYLFLLGVALQVFMAFWNKSIMWICHYGETKKEFKISRIYKCADPLSELYIIDFLCDLGSILLFASATVWVTTIIMKIP